ncbi:unnamed protein product [Pseudo-nitzschia multistriata]|uniref:PDZ domain-containing protein n=1 Tax=Pseudo-nitzschia multistriata TaxID=183589 RepID=A0A448ZLU8_9STRA|nr:unnamed protein product [Pseudo-nitzschia multistriata]
MANIAPTSAANYRSVTPAMNNVRRGVGASSGGTPNSMNQMRYTDSFNPIDTPQQQSFNQSQSNHGNLTPSSTGLLRLTLRKPMGIVFEPMYDPNTPSIQRGVRICDLPRTGAAALSRKLEVGDELLSINDKTMSRLTFDEIMDFIIEADPEEVNLLFRRPRKETLHARQGINLNKASNPNGPGVKWIDDEERNVSGGKGAKPETSTMSSRSGGRKDRKSSRRSGNGSSSRNHDDETLQSEDNDYSRSGTGRSSRGRKGRRRKDPYESESFLDILIDTICANPDSVCRDRRRGDDDYYSDDDETFASRDDSTYVTYESEDRRELKKKMKSKQSKGSKNRDDDSSEYGDETEEDTLDDKRGSANSSSKREKGSARLSPPSEGLKSPSDMMKKKKSSGKYEDDGTLETVDSVERNKAMEAALAPDPTPPLGLAPNPEPAAGPVLPSDTDDDGNPAPIKTVEYDDMDNGADVSVMESLGGPSLLIEKQRQAAAVVATKVAVPPVPADIIENFGKDYPLDFGFSREQTIQNDPLRFYTFVVKGLLQEHEPEKVRLLEKLLAKYRGREDHLVQKLSVRYNKEEEEEQDQHEHGLGAARSFEDAVNQGKGSAHANATIQTARERLQNDGFQTDQWPEKETKEQDDEDDKQPEMQSESGTEFSGDSIDGTSPAVIAQVSELLNYVYGKTSVPGQIDRVSTIMRAYEGREAVLLELLETKALIKANREKENAGQLPSFLRNSANAQRNAGNEMSAADGDVPPVTPMATQAAINDDISSMSGVSSPAEGQQHAVNAGVLKQINQGHDIAPHSAPGTDGNAGHEVEFPRATSSPQKLKGARAPVPEKGDAKKKKKGIFGGLFGGKKGKKSKDADKSERTASRTRGLRSPMGRKLKNPTETSA